MTTSPAPSRLADVLRVCAEDPLDDGEVMIFTELRHSAAELLPVQALPAA